jgi:hypothetical protein
MFGKNIVQDVQDGFVFAGRRVDYHVDARVGRGHSKLLLYGYDEENEYIITFDGRYVRI